MPRSNDHGQALLHLAEIRAISCVLDAQTPQSLAAIRDSVGLEDVGSAALIKLIDARVIAPEGDGYKLCGNGLPWAGFVGLVSDAPRGLRDLQRFAEFLDGELRLLACLARATSISLYDLPKRTDYSIYELGDVLRALSMCDLVKISHPLAGPTTCSCELREAVKACLVRLDPALLRLH